MAYGKTPIKLSLGINTFTMTKTEYLKALKALGLGPASKATVEALGVSIRQIQRLAAGDQRIPKQTELLLRAYLRHPDLLKK